MVLQRIARASAVTSPFGPLRLAAALIAWVFAATAALADTRPPVLDVEGMTFVASRRSVSEVVVRAREARFDTDLDIVHLQTVAVRVASGKSQRALEITCLRGELDLATSDFRAEGDVKGRTEGGLEFSADWVRYSHDDGMLFTDAPVLITDGGGTFRGGGFRYIVDERRFKLLGGASVVQEN